jgi:predicted nucleic acid-binding protein
MIIQQPPFGYNVLIVRCFSSFLFTKQFDKPDRVFFLFEECLLVFSLIVLVVQTEKQNQNIRQSQEQKLFGFLNLQFIKVDEHILSQAQGLINKYNLNPRDAIHVASAINQKIEIIISDDQDLDTIKEIKRVPLT